MDRHVISKISDMSRILFYHYYIYVISYCLLLAVVLGKSTWKFLLGSKTLPKVRQHINFFNAGFEF